MSRGTKRTISIAILFALLATAVFFITAFQVTAKGELLTKQVNALAEQTAQESSYHRLVRLAEETTEEREKLQTYFLEKQGDSIDFLYYVESVLAPQAKVVLETNSLELLEEKETEAAWLRVSFTFSGTRQAVQQFIQILETMPYVEQMTDVQLEAHSSTLWEAVVTMQIRVLAYDN